MRRSEPVRPPQRTPLETRWMRPQTQYVHLVVVVGFPILANIVKGICIREQGGCEALECPFPSMSYLSRRALGAGIWDCMIPLG